MGWRAILVVLGALPCLLQGELLPIRNYTTADGLAADHVNCIVPDSRGFLWFCTSEGLSRFDGYHFVSYGVREGLAHRNVSTLVETRSGGYFVGTALGMARINPGGEGARFTTYAPERDPSQNYVADLSESRSGKILCATSTGLFEWDAASGFHRRQLPLPPGVEIGSIIEGTREAICWDRQDEGNLPVGGKWIGRKTFSLKEWFAGRLGRDVVD